MFYIDNLLRNEYLPRELPPCYNSNDFADNVNLALTTVTTTNKRGYSEPLKYSGYKNENARRKFSVPNPYHYLLAVDFIVQHQTEIAAILNRSAISLTAPINKKVSANQPFTKRTNSVSETKCEIEKLFQNNRYEIRLDINSFFDNIYTHALSWAVHTKPIAKQHRNDLSYWGNCLDKILRAMNSNQTNGILIGNAVSRIASEIILCTVDEQLTKKFTDIACRRFVDDYYIYVKNSNQVQEVISFLRSALAQYELSLNESKLQVNESPFIYGNPGVEQIKHYLHLKPDAFLFHLIIEYQKQKDLSVLKYGLRVLQNYAASSDEWPAFQSRLLNLLVSFPALAHLLFPIFWANKEQLGKNAFKNALYSVINESIILQRDQELVWAIWMIKAFNIKISIPMIEKILTSQNDLALLIALDIIYSNRMENSRSIKQHLSSLYDELALEDVDSQGNAHTLLWTSHWLLAYEITRNKWLQLGNGRNFDFANKTPFFKALIGGNIKFYDPNFQYSAPSRHNFRLEYATKKDVFDLRKDISDILSKFQKSVSDRVATGKSIIVLNSEEEELLNDLLMALDNEMPLY